MLDLSYGNLVSLVAAYAQPKRSESAAFLIWYLVNYYRLDELEAVDSVCDQKGDKGVDGIYVNEGSGTIDVFQSRIVQNPASTIGDKALKEFAGTLAQFKNKESLKHLIDSAGDAEVARLIRRLSLDSILENFELRGIFLSNAEIDANGLAFLKAEKRIQFVGGKILSDTFISDKPNAVQASEAEFDVTGFGTTEYSVDKDTKAIIAPVKATDLVKLSGLADQSLFSLNVRASLGNTQVNRDIVRSVRDESKHRFFPLFHNGITVLSESVFADKDKIRIKNYFVVNGCQSLNALYGQRTELTDDLRLLAKFIQVTPDSPLATLITTYSNNQNGVRPRDFKSNHPQQVRLQNEFRANYKDKYEFEVKRGEPLNRGEIITNEEAGLYLLAFDLKEPWATHRKYQVFDEKYNEIFSRPEVTADRIVMCEIVAMEIAPRLANLKNQVFGKYLLVVYFMLYVVRKLLESDPIGGDMLENPGKFVRKDLARESFREVIGKVLDSVLIDLNLETEDLADDFDYRGKLRDKEYVTKLANDLVASYEKDVKRKKADSISDLWKTQNK